MHEMSLCERILQIIETEADKQGFTAVRRVVLELGCLSHVDIPALEFAFEVVVQGSVAAGAQLDIQQLAARAWCLSCARLVTVQQRHAACPYCGCDALQASGGDEMRIKELEII